ncbi:hypothetical protein ACWDA7_45105 [Streptomyces sp. NPDC001156]
MSNRSERGMFGDALMLEFGVYAQALTDAGHDWTTTWQCADWPVGSLLWWLPGRLELARKFAGMAGVYPSDAELTDEHKVRLAHAERNPDGPPSLTHR